MSSMLFVVFTSRTILPTYGNWIEQLLMQTARELGCLSIPDSVCVLYILKVKSMSIGSD